MYRTQCREPPVDGQCVLLQQAVSFVAQHVVVSGAQTMPGSRYSSQTGPRPMETECEPGPSFGTSIRRSNRQVSSLQRLRAPGCPAPWPERSSMPSIFRQSSRGLLRPGSRSFVRWGRRTPNANASGSRCRQGQRSRAGSHTTSVPRDLPDFLPGRSADWRRKQRWAPGRVVVAVGDAGPQRAAPRARISSRKRRILC